MSSSNTATSPVVSTPSTSVTPTTSAARDPTPLPPSSTSTPPATTSQAAPPATSQTITSPAPTTTPTTTSTSPAIVTATQAPLTSTFETVIVTTVPPTNGALTIVTQTITSSPSITPGGSEVTDPSSSPYTPSTSATDSSTANPPTSSLVNNSNGGGGGISGTAKVVVAVIVPIIGVAFVAILMLFLWKRRQKTRADAEARRKEVEEYGYNPNNDPHGGTAVTAAGAGVARSNSNGEETLYEMTESNGAGYRGWGSTNGGRKPSNIGSSVGNSVPLSPVGMAFSDGGFTQQQQGIISPGPDGYTGVATSPSTSTFPVGNSPSVDGSNAPLIHGSRPLTADSSVIGAMNGPAAAENSGGIHRGISNASSNYSAMTQSDQSDIGQPMSHHDAQYYGVDDGYEDAYYSSRNPAHPYSGDNGYGPAPVIRDVSARRNTRIETPTSTHFPQQGNSGIAQNF